MSSISSAITSTGFDCCHTQPNNPGKFLPAILQSRVFSCCCVGHSVAIGVLFLKGIQWRVLFFGQFRFKKSSVVLI
jgi:hypothetical protein